MIFTEEEAWQYCLIPDVYGSYYIARIFEHFNIILDEIQQNRFQLVDLSCNALYQIEIEYLLTIAFGSVPGGSRFPGQDFVYFMSVWILYGDPPADPSIPWGDDEVINNINNAITFANIRSPQEVREILRMLIDTYPF